MVTRSSILRSAYKAEVSEHTMPAFCNGVPVGMPVVDVSGVDSLMPINPVTGHRDGDLKRLFDPGVSVKEKELILSNLQVLKSADTPKGISDDDLMMMIPSRYISDPVEVEHYMQALKEYRDGIIASKEDENTDPEPAPMEPAPTPTPAE